MLSGARRRPLDELGTGLQRARNVGGVDAPRQFAPPRGEVIDPGADGIPVAAQAFNEEIAAPAVVTEELHRSFSPLVFRRVAPQQHARDQVVAIGENISFDLDAFAQLTFDGETLAIVLRGHGFYQLASPAIVVRALHRCDSHYQPPPFN